MPASCKDIRKPLPQPPNFPDRSLTQCSPGAALALCLQSSDCVLINRNTPADCLRPPLSATLPTQCLQLRHGYGECKRGQIDMRKRFRGNKPVATSTEMEAGGGRGIGGEQEVGMLYAGRGSFGKEGEGGGGKEGDEWEVYTRNDGIEDVRKK
ncbi:hypothetical protein LTR35_008834 [Friedmanniomyces endolithicus]|uniref:Cytochrome c oxidase assembly protein PET191 n=1 Tax=Friedmanniomyces endolithicus TaxID=329885 RepID=A0AAN6FKB0_9PEZI|nr:hypothetical protein LTR35_008834 [Friedmanniomyces endolithicus]KAK0294983.1 hypothetical protein LTS00_006449 [Friedmanniomyces endolithicus]KAK0319837.1 hypothetical protein LTR82_009172 [Friedmanniomyces endolithicus]KAK0990635.1 hypothetical protein LTR54_011995 [Friedmanniomyces endolithicus]KAK1055976.1 hypothetical protein LTR74_015286 [Friedmanniomyces endolithicus]